MLLSMRGAVGRVDFRSPQHSFACVGRFRNQFVAGFLLAFWLLATQHCGLEAAGLFDSHGDQPAGCCQATDGCRGDGCRAIEGGEFRPDGSSVKIATPQLTACLCLACGSFALHAPEFELAATPTEILERPRDWVSTWHFVQRAALSPRAPSAILA